LAYDRPDPGRGSDIWKEWVGMRLCFCRRLTNTHAVRATRATPPTAAPTMIPILAPVGRPADEEAATALGVAEPAVECGVAVVDVEFKVLGVEL